jgi:DNA-binding winged helix-turn-helix (wHTH) protein/Tol biopolymer transport system component
MEEPSLNRRVARFGAFELDVRVGEVRKNGVRRRLCGQPFQVLSILLENAGEIVGREILRKRLWPEDTFVDFDHSLGVAINKIREALGDSAEAPRFIETVRGRGYRFIAPVTWQGAIGSTPPDLLCILPERPGQMSLGARPWALLREVTKVPQSLEKHETLLYRSETGTSPLFSTCAAPAVLFPAAPDSPGVNARGPSRHWQIVTVAALAATFLILAWAGLRHDPQAVPEIRHVRLTFNPNDNPVTSWSLSPDGRYLAFSDSAGIHLKSIDTGEERAVSRPPGAGTEGDWYAGSWFPGATRFLADLVEPGGRSSIWVVSIFGAVPRRLRDGAVSGGISPDGRRIAFSPATGLELQWFREVWVMGPDGSNPRKLLSFENGDSVGSIQWSPEGRRLACLRVQYGANGKEAAVLTCDLDGENSTTVINNPRLIDFCWLHDGRIVYSQGEPAPTGNCNLWQIRVNSRTGKPHGEPLRITNWAGSFISGLEATADGRRIVCGRQECRAHIYLGELQARSGSLKGLRRLTLDESNQEAYAWTHDGKAVIFASDWNGRTGIFKQNPAGDAAEPLVTGLSDLPGPIRISADGAWVLYPQRAGLKLSGSVGIRLLRVPTTGGPPQEVLESRNLTDFRCGQNARSLCVLDERSLDGRQVIITAFDPLKGRGRLLRTVNVDPGSPYYLGGIQGASTLALLKAGAASGRIRLLSLTGRADRNIIVRGWGNIWNVDWSPQSKFFYCGSASPRQATLLRVDSEGRARVLWTQNGLSRASGVPSPDSRLLAISAQTTKTNVWMLQDF